MFKYATPFYSEVTFTHIFSENLFSCRLFNKVRRSVFLQPLAAKKHYNPQFIEMMLFLDIIIIIDCS